MSAVRMLRYALLLGVAALAGCVATQPWSTPATLPAHYQTVREQFVLHSDVPLDQCQPLVDGLIQRQGEIAADLGLPRSDELIEIYLFVDADSFQRFMRPHFPGLPKRRAYFVETNGHRAVYAQWGDRAAVDLRHEATHGYLHSVVRNLPVWIDEGLAKYFECPREAAGRNAEFVDWFRQQVPQGWRPDLARLERLPQNADLDQAGYAESWAWVHYLLNSWPEQRDALRAYLADLRRDGQSEPISQRLRKLTLNPADAMLAHTEELVNCVPTPKEMPVANPRGRL